MGEGSKGIGWLPSCVSPGPRIPQRQRGCQERDDREKGGEQLGSSTAPHSSQSRTAFISLICQVVCVCEGEDTEQGGPWTCECYVGSPLATRNPEAMGY